MSTSAALALASGQAVQALVNRSGTGLAAAIGWVALLGTLTVLSDVMLSRVAVTNWVTATVRVQRLLARKVLELGATLERRTTAGEVVAVGTSDAEKIGWFVEATARFGASLAACAAVVTMLFVNQPVLGLVVAVGVPLLAVSSLPLIPAATRRFIEQRVRAGRAVELASDIVAGLRVLRGVGGEELYLARYRSASQAVRRAAVHSAHMSSLIVGQQVLLRGLFVVTAVWCGIQMTLDQRMSVGDLVTCYGLVAFLMTPLAQFEEIATAWIVSRPAAERVARLLALQREQEGIATEPPVTGACDATGDLYDPATGLRVRAGQLTAVVCGDPDTGERLVERLGGHSSPAGETGAPSACRGAAPLGAPTPEAARRAVLLQGKDPVLLSGTVEELLDVPRSGAVSADQALDAAQCGDVLEALAHASATPVDDPVLVRITERGRSVSGGQRQRLALARSLVTDPDVLVLDEPTSAVDAHTEARIAESLKRIRKGRTTVVFTFSPLLLDRADHVVLVADGRVRNSGSHRELLLTAPEYRALVVRDPGRAGEPADQGGPTS
ncbi:ABC transporter transmembrane domain-containing protein [Streptomyces sp. NPDC003016]